MARKTIIDRETTQRIIDTANIVDVVSDFVSLKRRGANYIGLCPFHNERTPSFSVSPAKNICKCFSCGKGGSPVNFIMEHEQMTYWEALRYLAQKYHIEIVEHEMTDEERRQQSERQELLRVNEFAMKHFEERMMHTDEGRDVGLSYFRHRGINDAAIAKFHLGFALEKRDDLSTAALKEGYSKESLVTTGLCFANDRGELTDRFRGRVIYPVHTIAGKVVAFGGRILTNDKKLAKYVNSPESSIYSKSRELYGLYQAKGSIVRKDKCILVEGYMDVISMSQSGIENVVASSGTSLTKGQAHLIHRFSENVTVIYDSDAAGIKASLRGIDILLAEGLNIKVLLLPDGDDPDSFAQSHSSAEVEEYIDKNEVDFIRFKTDILLKDTANDPIERAKAVASIVGSIAVIPNEITRNIYIRECSQRFEMDEAMLTRQVAVTRTKQLEKIAEDERRQAARDSIANPPGGIPAGDFPPEDRDPVDEAARHGDNTQATVAVAQSPVESNDYKAYVGKTGLNSRAAVLAPQERAVLRLMLKFGMLDMGDDFADVNEKEGTVIPIKVIDYIVEDLAQDSIVFENPALRAVYDCALQMRDNEWDADYNAYLGQAAQNRDRAMAEGRDMIAREAANMDEIHKREVALNEKVNEEYILGIRDFCKGFFIRRLLSHSDDIIRRTATDLVVEKHQLSKIYTKHNTKVETEEDRLDDLVPRSLIQLKYDTARCFFMELQREITALQKEAEATGKDNLDDIFDRMQTQQKWHRLCSRLATQIGERVYEPLR